VRFVEAWWEHRNLGVVTYEGEVESTDAPEVVREALTELPDGYHVIKVSVGQVALMRVLEEAGFSFTECSVQVAHDLRLAEPIGLFKRLVDATSIVRLDCAGICVVEEEIRKGMFATDRVVLDPRFSLQQAANRYVNWLRDEIERGAHVRELWASGRRAGFFVLRIGDDGVAHSVLSGLYDAARTPGLGSVLLYRILTEAAALTASRLSSYISTNNPAVIKTHIGQGFSIVDLKYVYVRMTTTH
jgi:hypothetical protein